MPCVDGSIQLIGSPVDYAGSVTVCINGTWGKICNGERDSHFGSVVCNQLGYSPYGIKSNIVEYLFSCFF